MTRVAAVDIGTNSTRLLVADVDGRGADATLEPVQREMRITRLGQGVDADRTLRPDAIERTVAVLREYGEIIERLGAERVRATATSASRDARNRDDFFDPATDALRGTRPELLAGEDEAALSFLGATAGLQEPAPFLVIDVGGGSTEFVLGTDKPEGLISIDIGCVRLTEQYLHGDPPEPEELSNAVSAVRDHLSDVEREIPSVASAATVVGLAGTVTTLAAIELGLTTYDPKFTHHFRLTRAAAEDVFRTLATEPIARRRHNPGLDPGRVDVIVGGAIIVVSILRHFEFAEMLVSETDILDGLARSLG
ncbi:MAG TPA: Ppx/GppA phosphatase family protein [Acidimicrobiia bacterium]|nr:Ppx/GppA phosphatase family protein [Acidimicrobiia bacterium]